MRKSIGLCFFISILSASFVSSVGAICLEGDLSGNCRVDFEDVLSLAGQWLDPPGGDADIIGDDGVNFADFAAQAKNWGKSRSQVIINEIHYDPDVKGELVEYIELYNRSQSDVDISGWYFDSGISYVFGNNVILGAGEYAVVAQAPDQVQSKFGVSSDILFGPWVGKLSNEGESIVLRNADGDKVDEVDYKIGFPWPTVGGPPGYSIEFVNPAFDNDLGGNWRPSEPDYVAEPTSLIEEGARWKYVEGYNEASEPNTRAWREIDFDDSSWPDGNLVIGYEEGATPGFIHTPLDMRYNYSSVYLRIEFEVDDPSVIGGLELDAIYDDGFYAYINNKFVRNVDMELDTEEGPHDGTANYPREDHNWNTFTLPAPSGYLKQGKNVLAIHLHNESEGGSSDCFLDVRLEATPLPAGPSPGRRNTSYSDNTSPNMRQVTHSPKEPKSGEDVTITAKITDSDGVEYVMLFYQAVDPGSYIELNDPAYETGWDMAAMNDDGIGGDIEAGDDIYTVVLGGSNQINRRLMRYRIGAWDYMGLETMAPYHYDYENEPVPNFAYFVYDGVPGWSGAVRPGATSPVYYSPEVLTKVPVYHVISKHQSVVDALYMPGAAAGQYGGDLYKWYGTLVYDGEVYDHIRYRARGGVWRYSMGKNMWKFDFNRGQSFQARDDYGKKYDTKWGKLNFSACIQQGDYLHRGEQGMFEAAGFKMFNLMGVPASKTNWLHLRVIDDATEAGPTQYEGDFWGLYMTIEQMDGRFLDEHLLPDGNLYKIENHDASSNNQGPTAVTDYSDYSEFKSGYYYDPNPSEQWWRDNVDLNSYYGYRCIVEGIHHGDIAYGKNWFFYLNPETDIWSMLPWDLDLTWANNMYGNGEDVFKSQGAIFSRSALLLEYRNRLREFHDLLYNTEQMNPMLDELAGFIDDPAGGPSMVDADRAMWDYNPIMTSGYVNSSKAGAGRFYQQAATKDFPGMVQIMKNYVNGYKAFDTYSEDSAAPYTPTIYYEGPAGYPINALQFRTSSFSDPQGSGTFAALKWRCAEVTDQSAPSYDQDDPLKLEIESVWESEEMTTFQADMRIPAVAVEEGHAYRVRCKMKDTSGRWSHWSSPIQFIVGEAISEGIIGSLRITEVMYNPAAADTAAGELNVENDEFEFIELKNIGDEAVDLTYVSFVQGITFSFDGSDVTSVEPGGFVLVVRNKAAFQSRYAGLTDIIAGQYIDTDTKLSNSMETVQLGDIWNGTVAEFEYSDGRGWPLPADGSGHSLVPLTSAIPDTPLGTLNYGGNWRHSAYIGGSPGADDPELPRSVVVNEVMAHTDYSNPAHPEHDSDDWIELFNTSGTTIGLSGWYLSDDKSDLKKWAIPAVNINGNGRISFNEVDHFHNPITSGFGLNKAGEEVLLSYLPGNSEDRVVDYIRFQGEENFVSLGRYPDGGDYWLHQSPSRDLPNNSGILDIVIDEVMYHPVDPNEEYVELYNPTAFRIYLENEAGQWRLDDQDTQGFQFAPGTYIEPGGRLIIVGFDPAVETETLDAFVSAYGIPRLTGGIDIVGPFPGNFANDGERLAVKRPQAPDDAEDPISWVIVDEVIYSDISPWPVEADGFGDALQRNFADVYHSGNDPANWRAERPTPGNSP